MAIKEDQKHVRMNISKLSCDGFFTLDSAYLKSLQNNHHLQQYEALIQIYAGNNARRRFYRVSINGATYWADVITGSLYNSAGRCMTSFTLQFKEQPIPVSGNGALQARLAA